MPFVLLGVKGYLPVTWGLWKDVGSDKAFSVLSEDYKTDPRRNKKDAQMYYDSLFAKRTKWGCMSFPEMTLPQRDGTSHPWPNAPEPAPLHADAGSQNK
jgi:hypothetical protein